MNVYIYIHIWFFSLLCSVLNCILCWNHYLSLSYLCALNWCLALFKGRWFRQWHLKWLVRQRNQRPKDERNTGKTTFIQVTQTTSTDKTQKQSDESDVILPLLSSPCRKILNDLSSEGVGKDSSVVSTATIGVTMPSTPIYQTSSGQYSMNSFLLEYLHKSAFISWWNWFVISYFSNLIHNGTYR